MKRNWRSVAERADNRSFGVDEISAAIMPALAGDCRDEMSPRFIENIRGIFEEQESLLIKDDVSARVEALRPEAGSGIGRRVIENVVRLSNKETADVVALVKAMATALQERAARTNFLIEEHAIRKSSTSRASNIRTRLEQATAGAAFDSLARQILKLDNNRPARSSAKRDGLDEGPKIK